MTELQALVDRWRGEQVGQEAFVAERCAAELEAVLSKMCDVASEPCKPFSKHAPNSCGIHEVAENFVAGLRLTRGKFPKADKHE